MQGLTQNPQRWPIFGWAALAGCGLVLALAAALGPSEGPATGAPPAWLVLGLPDPIKVGLFGLFAFAALLFFMLLFPWRRPRRKKEDDEFQFVHEQPAISPWALLGLMAAILLPLVLAAYFLWLRWAPVEIGKVASRPPSAFFRPGPPWPQAAPPPLVSAPPFSWAIALLGLAAGLGCLGLMLWIFFGDRLTEWRMGPPPGPKFPDRLMAAVEDGLDSLWKDSDVRRAIIECYRRFEQVLAGSGLPREPWETPTEFMQKALGRLRLPREAVKNLTGLFEVSRFSQHSVGEAERGAAVEALVAIKAALEEGGGRAVVG